MQLILQLNLAALSNKDTEKTGYREKHHLKILKYEDKSNYEFTIFL